MWGTLKRLVVGVPIPSSEEHHQRLTKKIALAVFASDAISSTAYATQEILLVLVPVAGMAALNDIVPLALVVCVLLAIVVTSYRQTIKAYPQGGGSYVVSRENLGRNPSLVVRQIWIPGSVLITAAQRRQRQRVGRTSPPRVRARNPRTPLDELVGGALRP